MKAKKILNLKKMLLVSVLSLGLSLSVAGRNRAPANTYPLAATTEMQTIGGDQACAFVGGLTVGLAIGAFTPCSVFCLAGALTGVVALASC